MKHRKPQVVLALLASALALACSHEQNAAVNHPQPTTSPSSGVPEGDRTGANPNDDVDHHPEHLAPTPPGTPPEDQRIPEEIAPSK